MPDEPRPDAARSDAARSDAARSDAARSDAEQRPDPAGAAARSMAQLARQMQEMTDRMLGAGRSGGPGLPAVPGLPAGTPVSMTARQVQAVVDDVAARRAQVRALVAQLEAFDEQLGTLEASLRPLLQWLRTWADMEGAVTDFWTPRPPTAGPPPPRS